MKNIRTSFFFWVQVILQKSKYTIIFAVALFANSVHLFAQYELVGDIVMQAPQTWSFMKYGGQSSVDMYTGTLHVDIPIYTYKDNDFEIPVSVGYGSNGYKPNIQSGILGLGWYLNAGGSITREVRGVPDDYLGLYEYYTKDLVAFYPFKGYIDFYDLAKKGFPNYWHWEGFGRTQQGDMPFNTSIPYINLFLPNNYPGATIKYPEEVYESLSDIYHFKFGEHKGSFCFGQNGDVFVFNTNKPAGEYRISYSRQPSWNNNSLHHPFDAFTITTGDGYKYTFGGNFQRTLNLPQKEVDHTIDHYLDEYDAADVPFYPQVTLTWHLRKIEAPNKRNVIFEYSDLKLFDVVRPHLLKTSNTSNYPISVSDSRLSQYKQYSIRLDNIVVDNKLAIVFNYGIKTSERAVSNMNLNQISYLDNIGKLNKIHIHTVGANSKTIKECDFIYNAYSGQSAYYMTFLKEMNISGEGTYAFQYYNENSPFPYHGTSSFDHWGYYNKKFEHDNLQSYDRTFLIADTMHNSNWDEIIRSVRNYREPNFNGAVMGMLEKIVYPTKGYTIIEYEGNRYVKKVNRNNTTDGMPVLMDRNIGGYDYGNQAEYPAGGVRVKKITDYSASNESTFREYIYTDNSNNGSGVLLHYPRYVKHLKIKYYTPECWPLCDEVTKYTMSSSSLFNFTLDQTHISYFSVKERWSDQSYTVHKFTSYIDYPDIPLLFNNNFKIGTYSEYYPAIFVRYPKTPLEAHYYSDPVSFHLIRGKPVSKKAHKQNGDLVQKTTIEYLWPSSPYYEEIKQTHAYRYIAKLLVRSFLPETERTVTYFDSDSLVQNRHFSYADNDELLLSAKTTVGTQSESKHTFYAKNLANQSGDPVISFMQNQNYVLPIGQSIVNENEQTKQVIKFNYAIVASPNGGQQLKLGSIAQTNLDNPVNFSYNINSYNFDIEKTFVYDKLGRILQVTDRNGISTCYVWGYGGLYPVARIENATLSQITTIQGFNNIENNPLEDNLSIFDGILRSSLPNALVTTYEYEPYVGMTKITDSSGKSSFYEYDQYGKLITIKDDSGQTINFFEYSTSNQ